MSVFKLSQDVLVICMVSDPRKVSVSTEVDGMERERLDRMELMEDVLFLIWTCRWMVDGIIVGSLRWWI